MMRDKFFELICYDKKVSPENKLKLMRLSTEYKKTLLEILETKDKNELYLEFLSQESTITKQSRVDTFFLLVGQKANNEIADVLFTSYRNYILNLIRDRKTEKKLIKKYIKEYYDAAMIETTGITDKEAGAEYFNQLSEKEKQLFSGTHKDCGIPERTYRRYKKQVVDKFKNKLK